MSKKEKAKHIEGAQGMNEVGEMVLLWKATMPLSVEEHEQVADKLRTEAERSGVKIVLLPYSVDGEFVRNEADADDVIQVPATDTPPQMDDPLAQEGATTNGNSESQGVSED